MMKTILAQYYQLPFYARDDGVKVYGVEGDGKSSKTRIAPPSRSTALRMSLCTRIRAVSVETKGNMKHGINKTCVANFRLFSLYQAI
jgi:hypothetical protein